MTKYDPDILPVPAEWLALDEQERIRLIEEYHRVAGVETPSAGGHASFHAIVENQIAEGFQSTVEAMNRLTKKGLSRHDALHAIGSMAAEQFISVLTCDDRSCSKPTRAYVDPVIDDGPKGQKKRRGKQ